MVVMLLFTSFQFSMLESLDLLLACMEHPQISHSGRRPLSVLGVLALMLSQWRKEGRSLWDRLYPSGFLFLFAAGVGSLQGSALRSSTSGGLSDSVRAKDPSSVSP